MQTIGAYEAKTSLSKLLERVHQGERISITKHGVTVAILQPPATSKRLHPQQAIAALRMFRDKHNLKGLPLRKLIEEGRR